MLHLRNQSGGELSIKTEQHEICGQRTVLYLQGFDGDRPGLGEIRRVLVSHSACPIPGLGFQFVPGNSGAKTGRIKKEKNEKHGIFQGKGGVRGRRNGGENARLRSAMVVAEARKEMMKRVPRVVSRNTVVASAAAMGFFLLRGLEHSRGLVWSGLIGGGGRQEASKAKAKAKAKAKTG
jgi:hypothetical protein